MTARLLYSSSNRAARIDRCDDIGHDLEVQYPTLFYCCCVDLELIIADSFSIPICRVHTPFAVMIVMIVMKVMKVRIFLNR